MEWFNITQRLPINEEKVLLSVNGIYSVCEFIAPEELFRLSTDSSVKFELSEGQMFWTSFSGEYETTETTEQETRQKIREVESLLSQIIDASKDIIIVLDKQLNFLIVNKSYEAIMGLERTNILGKNLFEINPKAKDTLQHEYMNRAAKGETLHLDALPGIAKPEFIVVTSFKPLILNKKVEGVIIRSETVARIH